MERTAECKDCGASLTVGERGVPPERCPSCKVIRRREVERAYRARKTALQKERRRRAIEERPPRPPEYVPCSLCGISFPRRGRKGIPPQRCPICACFMTAIGRAFRYGRMADGDDFTSDEVFEADDYRCQLCGGLCSGSFPEPMAPSIDHITPIARGGRHVRSNVRTAHLLCNMSRGVGEPRSPRGTRSSVQVPAGRGREDNPQAV